MFSAIGRAAAFLGVAAAFAFAFAAPAQAHHIPACPGFSDPKCNVDFFYAHNVGPGVDLVEAGIRGATAPVVDPVMYNKELVEAFVEWCSADIDRCARAWADSAYYTYVEPEAGPVLGAVGATLDDVMETVELVRCRFFGACS